jgi:hypothetical protein
MSQGVSGLINGFAKGQVDQLKMGEYPRPYFFGQIVQQMILLWYLARCGWGAHENALHNVVV